MGGSETLSAGSRPGKEASPAEIEQMFGPPEETEDVASREFMYMQSGFPQKTEVEGRLLTYGPLSLMVKDDQIRYMWVESQQDN